jgi:hypothetical protein
MAALGKGLLCLGIIATLSILPFARADDKETATEAPAKKLPSLEQALVDSCPAILEHLRKEEYTKVGVLKFQVQRGKGPLTDNAGPINRRMADRLETALILSLKDDNIRVLRGASDTLVRSRKSISHATEEGRKALLELDTYSPAWGKETKLSADAMLTGVIHLDPRKKTSQVTINVFDKSGKLAAIRTLEVEPDTRLLSESGVSYSVVRRGLKSGGAPILKVAKEVREEAPVEFQILYDGKAPALEEQSAGEDNPAETVVVAPAVNQRVTFRLKHRGKDKNVYGVVLRLNGKNTIYPDEVENDDQDARKWIVKPGSDIIVKGFHVDAKSVKPFKVEADAAALSDQFQYKDHIGTFSVVIFTPLKEGEEDNSAAKPGVEPDAVQQAIRRGSPVARSTTLEALQKKLRSTTPSVVKKRGAIGADEGMEKASLREVVFKPSPDPAFSMTIRYLKKPAE